MIRRILAILAAVLFFLCAMIFACYTWNPGFVTSVGSSLGLLPTPTATATPIPPSPTSRPTTPPPPPTSLPAQPTPAPQPTPAAASEYKLTVIHTSEIHGHWEPFTQTIPFGGVAQRATRIQAIRKESPNSILLDSGDVSQGTLYFVQHRLSEAAQLYNALGYDAVTLGNHEFDLGPKTLAENYVANAKFGIVSTNIDFSTEPLLAGKIPATIVKTIGGEKIGLIGFTTPELPTASSPGPNIKMKATNDAAKAAISDLERQGVNKIIAISHMGYFADQRLAREVDGIDVIVSGHTSTLLGDATKLPKELGAPEGAYPTVARSPNGGTTLIVHAFEWGKLLGRLDVTFDAKGNVTRWNGEATTVDQKIPADPTVDTLLKKLSEPLTTFRQSVIGKTDVLLNGEREVVRNQESNLGNVIADAMLEATQNDKTVIALMNGGGIRTSIKAGDITVGNVLEVLPFGNRLVQLDMKGSEIVAALENGVSRVNTSNPADSAGRFPQVSGIRFAWDASKPTGQRITGVEVGNATTGYKPIDLNATYRVVTNDFMASGGDGYEAFTKGANRGGGDVPIDQALLDYIKARGTLNAKVEGRIMAGKLPTAQAAPTPTPAAARPTAPQALPATGAATTETNLWMAVLAALGVALLIGSVMLRRYR
jgi:5'-nucleotidase